MSTRPTDICIKGTTLLFKDQHVCSSPLLSVLAHAQNSQVLVHLNGKGPVSRRVAMHAFPLECPCVVLLEVVCVDT